MIKVTDAVSKDEKLKGALSYLLGPLSGIIILFTEKNSIFIRHHAMQSTVVFGALILLYVILPIIPIFGWILFVIISPILSLVSFIIWLVLMWKAYSGEKYKLPYFGDLSDRQVAKLG